MAENEQEKEEKYNGYELSRAWFNFCYENPEMVNTNHTALYFFAIDHCNRMGWKQKFGFPSQMAMDAIGIKNYKTYSKTFNDLLDWNFLKLYQKSHNQYSANVIGLVKNTKAKYKALSKASQKHEQKQAQRIVGIDKPNNLKTLEPKTVEPDDDTKKTFFVTELIKTNILDKNQLVAMWCNTGKVNFDDGKKHLAAFLDEKIILEKGYADLDDLKSHITNWFRKRDFTIEPLPPKIDKKKIDGIDYTDRPGDVVH